MSEAVEVELLPTRGTAYSMKTLKQGRKETPSELNMLDGRGKGMHRSRCGTSKRRKLVRYDIMAGRILRYKESSDRQKDMARKRLEGNKDLNYIIAGINRMLVMKHGNIYKQTW